MSIVLVADGPHHSLVTTCYGMGRSVRVWSLEGERLGSLGDDQEWNLNVNVQQKSDDQDKFASDITNVLEGRQSYDTLEKYGIERQKPSQAPKDVPIVAKPRYPVGDRAHELAVALRALHSRFGRRRTASVASLRYSGSASREMKFVDPRFPVAPRKFSRLGGTSRPSADAEGIRPDSTPLSVRPSLVGGAHSGRLPAPLLKHSISESVIRPQSSLPRTRALAGSASSTELLALKRPPSKLVAAGLGVKKRPGTTPLRSRSTRSGEIIRAPKKTQSKTLMKSYSTSYIGRSSSKRQSFIPKPKPSHSFYNPRLVDRLKKT
eukprot:789931_1